MRTGSPVTSTAARFAAIRKIVADTLRHVRFSSRGGYYLQLAAAWGWSSLPWLFTLRQPTLIMAGADDPLVPTINACIMQWLMPDARLEILDCGHLFLITRAEESARVVESFLTEAVAKNRAFVPGARRPRHPNPHPSGDPNEPSRN